jgi:hypothetical protein
MVVEEGATLADTLRKLPSGRPTIVSNATG